MVHFLSPGANQYGRQWRCPPTHQQDHEHGGHRPHNLANASLGHKQGVSSPRMRTASTSVSARPLSASHGQVTLTVWQPSSPAYPECHPSNAITEHWSDGYPTVLFSTHQEQSAHIDGERCWVSGTLHAMASNIRIHTTIGAPHTHCILIA